MFGLFNKKKKAENLRNLIIEKYEIDVNEIERVYSNTVKKIGGKPNRMGIYKARLFLAGFFCASYTMLLKNKNIPNIQSLSLEFISGMAGFAAKPFLNDPDFQTFLSEIRAFSTDSIQSTTARCGKILMFGPNAETILQLENQYIDAISASLDSDLSTVNSEEIKSSVNSMIHSNLNLAKAISVM